MRLSPPPVLPLLLLALGPSAQPSGPEPLAGGGLSSEHCSSKTAVRTPGASDPQLLPPAASFLGVPSASSQPLP